MCVDLSKWVKRKIERRNVATLKSRLTALIAFSFVRLMNRIKAAPASGQQISILSIGNPNMLFIVCSIIYLRSIMAIISRMPVAMMVA
jgi:hypothetical protein